MLTLNDGRAELWQWDTGRTLSVDADCSQVHFSNKVFGRSIDVDVVDGAAIIPDVLLQTDKDLNVWAFVGTAENGYTKISKTFKVNRRNKPADYVFTPTDQMTLQTIQSQIGDLADLTTEAKENLVAAINEAAASSGAGSMDLRVADGHIQYSTDSGSTWKNLIAVADLKGEKGDTGATGPQGPKGEPGKDGGIAVTNTATVGQTIKVSAVDSSGKPTAWEAVDMPSGGGHWETVLDTVWEQDVINPTAYNSETGIFTCAEGELNNLELNKEYIFFQQCTKEGIAYNTIINLDTVKVTKLSDTTFSIDATPPTTFVPTNVKFSKGACLAITDIDAKKIRLTLDGQFHETATNYDNPFFGAGKPYFAVNIGHPQIRNAYQAYQQVTAEVESPYRIVGEILCGFNAPSNNANYHFKNNSFCCPLIPSDVPEGNARNYFLTSDGTKIAKLYSSSMPWFLGSGYENVSISYDFLEIISGTKVKLERWVE